MELRRAKGTEDFPPEKKILRDEIVETLKNIFEIYGFDPLETPILELYSTLSSKYAGGSEILKETFKLKDQGKRDLGLRYDLTVPLARFIAMNPQLSLPFKRYQIEKVFRDGPVTKSRIREFWQCDVDIVGAKNLTADIEIIQLAIDIMKEFKLKSKIKINNKKLLNEIVNYIKINNPDSIILSIDKLYKIGKENLEKELKEKNLSQDQIKKLLSLILVNGTNKQKLEKIEGKLKNSQGINELKQILKFFKNEVEFDPSLARGLSYYTGTIFEIILKDKNLGCSVGGGGRYDSMIGSFSSNRNIPAVGISFGLEPLTEVLQKIRKNKKTNAQVYLIPINTLEKTIKIAKKLRDAKIKTDLDLNERNISKNLNYANNKEIPYVIFVGEKELKQKKLKLRDMKTGKERLLTLNQIISFLKD